MFDFPYQELRVQTRYAPRNRCSGLAAPERQNKWQSNARELAMDRAAPAGARAALWARERSAPHLSASAKSGKRNLNSQDGAQSSGRAAPAPPPGESSVTFRLLHPHPESLFRNQPPVRNIYSEQVGCLEGRAAFRLPLFRIFPPPYRQLRVPR